MDNNMIHYSKFDFSILDKCKRYSNSKHPSFINLPFAFDIETTSLYYLNNEWVTFDYSKEQKEYENVQMYSICYIWMFGTIINGEYLVWYGDTLEEFRDFLIKLVSYADSDIYLYIHNASFEFQYLRNVFQNMKVFSRKSRKIIYFTIPLDNGRCVECRCTYLLTNMSLEDLSQLNDTYVKASGDLDYDVLRLPGAYKKMSDKERGYCKYDILSVLEFLQKKVKDYQSRYDRIPLTQTGCMRKVMKREMAKEYKWQNDSRILVPFTSEYMDIAPSFGGGFSGENYLFNGKILEGLQSWDLVSAYIWELVSQIYPITHFNRWNVESLEEIPESYLWVACVTFEGIKTFQYFPCISVHKCSEKLGVKGDNGKLWQAKKITTVITNVDYDVIKACYDFKSIKINWIRAAKGSLINDKFRLTVLDFFSKKETLKKYSYHGSPEFDYLKNEEFMRSKEYLNATYGANVTNYVADEILFNNNEWDVDLLTPLKVKAILDDMRTKKQIFRWTTGLFIPAYNRRDLLLTIYQLGSDAVYTDTDSVKCFPGNEMIFEAYNKRIEHKARMLCNDLITYDMLKPKKRLLGTFGREENIDKFISLGAKKYICQYGDKLDITVAGLGKKKAEGTLKKIEEFAIGRKWDYKTSGRMTAYYLDNMQPITINGIKYKYKYGVVLRPTTYVLGVTDEYCKFLKKCKDDFDRSGAEYATEIFMKGERILYD